MNTLAPPISHKTILKYSGIIGFILPIVLVIGNITAFESCQTIFPSISTYYHSGLGDYFVASLGALAFCFYAYDGYNTTDKILSKIASLALLGVALLPTHHDLELDSCILSNARNDMIGNLHYVSAAIFFLIISFFCIVQFPKGNKPYNRRKKGINIIFRISGILMILCILFILVYSVYLKKSFPILENYSPIFWCEAIALWLFSISWFLKGGITFE